MDVGSYLATQVGEILLDELRLGRTEELCQDAGGAGHCECR